METTKEREQNQARLSSAEGEGVRQSQTTNENIRQLLEMLDNPDAYTEQEINDIINRDEETRETYRLMVEAKRSSRHRQHQKPADVDAAWQRFISSKELKVKNKKFATAHPTAQPHSSFFTLHSSFQKIAASFIGVLLVSGIAFAAIHIVRQYQKSEALQVADTTVVANSPLSTIHPSLQEDTVTVQPVIFDNIPLEKFLSEIAAHYDIKVIFLSDEARQLRFRFVWNPQQGIDQVVSDLNQFERLAVILKDNQITVDEVSSPSEK